MEVPTAALDRQEGVVDYEVESICSELENAELTEEETTSLLNDALELNKRLKAELRRQEEERHRSDGMQSQPGNGNNRSIGVSKRSDALSASLPPIHPKRGLSLNQRRIRNSVEVRGHSKKTNAKNASVMQRKIQSAEIQGAQRPSSSGSNRRPRGTQSAEARPEWNDRLSTCNT